MTKIPAPSACRNFGTNRIQSSSPAPMTKMAISRTTRLRLSPKKLPSRVKRFTRNCCRNCRCDSSERSGKRRLQLRFCSFRDFSLWFVLAFEPGVQNGQDDQCEQFRAEDAADNEARERSWHLGA